MPSQKRPHLPPLEKGQACTTCKARKVKCDAQLPACSACLRTAGFEGRPKASVQCCYTQAPRKSRKNRKTSSPSMTRAGSLHSHSSIDEAVSSIDDHRHATSVVEFPRVLPDLPPLPSSKSVVTAAPSLNTASRTASAVAPVALSSAVEAGPPFPLSLPLNTSMPNETLSSLPMVPYSSLNLNLADPLSSAADLDWSKALASPLFALDSSDPFLALLRPSQAIAIPGVAADNVPPLGSPESFIWSDFSSDDCWSTPSPPSSAGAEPSTATMLKPTPSFDTLALPQWFSLPQTPSIELGQRNWIW